MIRRNPPIRLLIVDDDAESAAELAELLEAHGAEVRLAGDVRSALRAHVEQCCDLALIDLELGAASGVGLARRWHCAPSGPRVILLSGRSLTNAEQGRFGSMPPPLLRKPMDLAALVAQVDRLFPTSLTMMPTKTAGSTPQR